MKRVEHVPAPGGDGQLQRALARSTAAEEEREDPPARAAESRTNQHHATIVQSGNGARVQEQPHAAPPHLRGGLRL